MKVLFRRFSLVLTLFFSTCVLAQRPPLCDVECTPDPGSSNYSGSRTARPKLLNARGYSSSLVAMSGSPAIATVANETIAGSQSFNYTIPLLSLAGRAGMDLALNLYYNSRVWDIDTVNGTATFNAGRDFPSYGFRLDFGFIEYDSTNDQYILTEADGTKRALANTSGYQSNDGSFITYSPSTSTTSILSYKNGATVAYLPFPSQPSLFRPVWIKDTNGNYFSIGYVSGHDQMVDAVSDTMARVIHFNYDANSRLTSITQNVQTSSVDPNGVHTYATFTWGTASLNYAFASPLAATNSPVSGTSINVLTGCTYANGTGYRFTYGDWGIIKKIEKLSSIPATRSYVSYNFPLASDGALSDAPAYTQETVSSDGASASEVNWAYAFTKNGTGIVTGMTVTDPNGNKTMTSLDANGRPSSLQMKNSAGTALRTINYTWTTVGTSASQVPSMITTTLNDTGQQSSVQYSYDPYGNATDVQEFDFGGALKRETVMTFAGGSYITKHILNLPTQVLAKDGTGATQARTDLGYDSTSFSNTTDITAANHDNSAYGISSTVRGNLTSVTRYANAAAGTGTVTRTFTFDSLGNLRSAQLDCCNQKKFNFSGATQYNYPDSIVRGPDPSPQFTTSYTYNNDKGLM